MRETFTSGSVGRALGNQCLYPARAGRITRAPTTLRRYTSPNPVTSDSIDVPPGFLHHSPCHLCYDGFPVAIEQLSKAFDNRSYRKSIVIEGKNNLSQ